MMKVVLFAFAGTAILYFILQKLDDDRCKKKGAPLASKGRRIALFFFLFVVTLVLLHFLGFGLIKQGGANAADDHDLDAATHVEPIASHKQDMLKHIHEDIDVGLPPF